MEIRHNPRLSYILLPTGALAGAILTVGLTSLAEDTELDSGPRAIPYNGILEFNGQSLNGQADLQFTLTDVPGAEDAEGANCYFEEEHDNVTAYSGRFSVNIGQPTGDLPDCVFDSDAIYIEVDVREADSDGDYVALTGSQRIHPVPFSYWAAEGSDFKVDGDLKITGAIQDPVDSVVEIDSAVDVSGALVNSSVNDLDEDQPIFINDDLTINGELSDSDGTLLINDDVAIYSSLNAQGRVFNSTNANGGNVYIDDGLRVEESAYIGYNGSGSLTVDGNTNLKSNLFNGGSSNSGRVYIADGLNVKDNTTIGSDGSGSLTVNGDITVTGQVLNVANREVDYLTRDDVSNPDNIVLQPSTTNGQPWDVSNEGAGASLFNTILVEQASNTLCFLVGSSTNFTCTIGTVSVRDFNTQNTYTYFALTESSPDCVAKCYAF